MFVWVNRHTQAYVIIIVVNDSRRVDVLLRSVDVNQYFSELRPWLRRYSDCCHRSGWNIPAIGPTLHTSCARVSYAYSFALKIVNAIVWSHRWPNQSLNIFST